jgi:hypothetical protein
MYEKVIERLLWNTAQHEYSTCDGCELTATLRGWPIDTLVIGSSEQVHVVDALAITGDEGRGSLRKAVGSWQTSFDPLISEWGNPARMGHPRLNT